MTESVTFLRASASAEEDSQGSPMPGADVARVSEGWAVAPAASSEAAEEFGQQVIVGYTLYKRNVIEDVTSFDRAVVRGEMCAVVGQVGDWVSPFRPHGGTVVNVKRGV
jgi:hypothetical protein